MKILVIYFQPTGNDRKTIDEHLYSFQRYSAEECYYINTYLNLPFFLDKIEFDLIVYHYTFLGQKWGGVQYFSKFLEKNKVLQNLKGYKVALPQDEYVNTEVFCKFLKDFNIDKLYTCFYEKDWDKVYPQAKTGLKAIETCLTGYVDEISLKECEKQYKPHQFRTNDIGYRARKVPYWLGEHGTIKWRITEIFQSIQSKYPLLKMNISNLEKDVFIGDSWHEFLLNCRVVLGCEGGASLHDPQGLIRDKVDTYVASFPSATFEEVKKACFPLEDNGIELFAISPRHFDACITKTCQVLLEGKYHGIFQPGIHYIELKKDYSNLEDVVMKIQDVKYCESLTENAFKDIIESGLYTYKNFVSRILQDAVLNSKNISVTRNELSYKILVSYYYFASKLGYLSAIFLYLLKRPAYLILKYTGLLPYVKSIILNRKFSRI